MSCSKRNGRGQVDGERMGAATLGWSPGASLPENWEPEPGQRGPEILLTPSLAHALRSSRTDTPGEIAIETGRSPAV